MILLKDDHGRCLFTTDLSWSDHDRRSPDGKDLANAGVYPPFTKKDLHMGVISKPEGLRGDIHVTAMTEDESEQAMLRLLFHIRQENIRANRQLFDHSRPSDEYFNSPDPQPAGAFTIQRDYDGPVRIESILASIPVGTTSALLDIGRERRIPLYIGGATTVQTLVNFQNLGIMANENDERILTLAGTMTSGFFIALAGWRFEWSGNA
jgi:hypothetical protein